MINRQTHREEGRREREGAKKGDETDKHTERERGEGERKREGVNERERERISRKEENVRAQGELAPSLIKFLCTSTHRPRTIHQIRTFFIIGVVCMY